MVIKILSKKVLIIISIIIVLFLVIFLPIYFLVIKKKSSDINSYIIKESSCVNYMVTFPFQTSNIFNNMIEIEITNELINSISSIEQFINIINNTTTTKPCYRSWFNTENDINTNHNNKLHDIKNIIINNNKIIITFEETTLNGTNPFPLHIHYYYNCINNVNSCDVLKYKYPRT